MTPWNSLAKILELVAVPSPGDLPNPGVNLALSHCRQILYQLSHQVKVKMPVKFKAAALLQLYIELECLRTLRTLLTQNPSDLSALEHPSCSLFQGKEKKHW